MTSNTNLQSLSDDELLRRLTELLKQSRRVESDLIAHLGEVDERRLFARAACASMFSYCTGVLHLSEGEAYLRIGVARASRRFPMIFTMLADGRLHLSGVAKLAPHLTEENYETVLARAAHRTKRRIEELVAELSPKPDVPAVIRKLPEPRANEMRPDAVKFEMPAAATPPVVTPRPAPPPVVAPLAPARYKIQFTAGPSFREKLERLKALLRPHVPDGDIGAIIEDAVTARLAHLEAKRFAETQSPRKTVEESDTSPGSRYIPAAVKRAVRTRDSDRCTFVDDSGRRCTERRGLEYHHDHPFGRGGDRSPENIRLLCRSHNAYRAELDYGRPFMAQYRRGDDRVSEPVPVYGMQVAR